jgi:starch-binding outer membrane protein, SusD/RagB family
MKNKKFISVLTIIIIVLAFNSCKKYLSPSPVSSFDPGFVFSNVPNAQKALLGVYQELTGDNGYGIRVSMYYPYDNDEMIGIHQIGDGDRGDIAHFTVNPSNGQLNTPFTQMYTGIERANQCIYYIPQMDMYNTGTTAQKGELQRLYGEALTLRAQYYLELIRNWGDVPAQWLPSSLEPDLFIAKTDRDTIYNHLLNDLQLAETLVPWRTDVAALGDPKDERITKGAVKGLRARIALYRGGYSLRSAASTYGQVMARPADYKTYYQIAKDECNDLMGRRDEHTLNTSFLALFKNNIDAHIIDPSGEVMFEVAMAGGTGSYDSKLGYYDGPKVTATVTSNAAVGVLAPYFYLFDSTDTRRDVTCAPYEVKADLTLTGHPATTIAEAKFRKDWITNPVAFTSSAQYYGINWPILRFSDVLLMYAEADNELSTSGPSGTAINALKEVSQRGHGGNAALVPVFPTDHDGFFNAIVKERSLEFGGEGIRKYDLIRWNLIKQRIADTKTNLTRISTRTGTFVGTYNSNNLDFSKIPDSVFYKTTSTTTTGVIWGTSFYAPRPVSAISGYTKIIWVSSAVAGILAQSGASNGYAYGFTPNHSELLPIPQTALDANFRLKQEYGY